MQAVLRAAEKYTPDDGLGPRGAPMPGGVRMMWPGMAPLVSGMPGSRPGDAGMPMYFRARSSMPARIVMKLSLSLQQLSVDELLQVYSMLNPAHVACLPDMTLLNSKSAAAIYIMLLRAAEVVDL